MKKYRLIRNEPGVLDLAPACDDQGRTLVLQEGQQAIIDAHTLKHPLVARYLGTGLRAEEVSLARPVQTPATPQVTAAISAPPTPPTPAPDQPEAESSAPSEDPEPSATYYASSDYDPVLATNAIEEGEEPEKKETKKKRRGRSSKSSRDK
jgi:hypothetical protein